MDDIERELRDLGERTARDPSYRTAPAGRIVRRARLRRALTMGAPALAVVLLAGVAVPRLWPEERAGESSLALLAGAVDATEDQGTARVEVEFEFRSGSEVVSSRASGVIDFDTGLTQMDVVYVDEDEERAVETITDGRTTFERPAGSPDAKWSEVELPPGAPAGPPDSSPGQFLRYVESVAREVARVGSEVRDGVEVTHYLAVLDLEKVAALSGQEPPEGLRLELDPMDLWVDEQGRVREATFGATTTLDDFSQTMEGSLRFFDFGTPADIELPGGDEVAPRTPEPTAPTPTAPTSPGTYVVGSGGIAEPHVVVESYGAGPSPLCVRVPGGGPEASAVVVDETTSQELFSATRSGPQTTLVQSYSTVCAERSIPHVKVDLLLGEPTRFTLLVGEGPDQVVVELAEVRGY